MIALSQRWPFGHVHAFAALVRAASVAGTGRSGQHVFKGSTPAIRSFSIMDSLKAQNDPLLRVWRIIVGGNEATGMIRLMGFLAAFVLIGGLIFALATR
ncbi:hypothetical protein [Aureimonas sp. N4]|uniref:hypothetical protein n=1 Tax=Aureimonas sp. N4 TaxID=1638165 RepID=UPI0007810662|nr:hypothetical protein [Aureimonas sp. N4]